LSLLRKAYNNFISDDKLLSKYIKSITGVTPNKLKLYRQAFQHRSSHFDAKDNNERLELLGDSVLDLLVAEFLYKKYPYKEEGFITELRSKIVNRASLNALGMKLGLIEKISWNKKNLQEAPKDIAGNTFEALVGVLYLDAGMKDTRKFIFNRVLKGLIDVETLEATETDYKSKLFHYVQKHNRKLRFDIASENQKNKRSYFVINLLIDDVIVSSGEGFSKKIAEQSAAYKALKELNEI
jgi:ribonuclease-3